MRRSPSGHQATAFALFASFFLLWKRKRPRDSFRVFLAGFLAAYAAVIELQVGPVSAILGLYLLAQCLRRRAAPGCSVTVRGRSASSRP